VRGVLTVVGSAGGGGPRDETKSRFGNIQTNRSLVLSVLVKTEPKKQKADTREDMTKTPRSRRYDLREYWPWYERKWPTRGGYATPPPFTLSAIGHQPAMPTWQRRALQAICVAAAIVFVIYIVWGIFFAK